MRFVPIIVGLLASLNLALLVAFPNALNAGLFAVTAVCFIVTLASFLRWGD
jgi:hypothetical protein